MSKNFNYIRVYNQQAKKATYRMSKYLQIAYLMEA